jgi:Na+/proline symporter
MINSFLSLNLSFTVVVFISTLFLFVGIFYSKKKVSLNTYLVSDRNEGVFSLSATLIASSLGAWILFGPPTAATWGGFGSVVGYALGNCFSNDLANIFWKKNKSIITQRKITNRISIKEVWKEFIQINFFLNDLLFIYISMRRSNRNIQAYLLYLRT